MEMSWMLSKKGLLNFFQTNYNFKMLITPERKVPQRSDASQNLEYKSLYPTFASGFLLDFLKSGSTALITIQFREYIILLPSNAAFWPIIWAAPSMAFYIYLQRGSKSFQNFSFSLTPRNWIPGEGRGLKLELKEQDCALQLTNWHFNGEYCTWCSIVFE